MTKQEIIDERIRLVKEAINHAMKRDQTERPFVVLSIIELSCFVQFRVSAQESLLLDIPIISKQEDYGVQPDDKKLTAAVIAGLETLYGWVSLDTLNRFTIENVLIDIEIHLGQGHQYYRGTLPRQAN